VEVLDTHRAGLDIDAARARMRQLAALSAFAAEHGDKGLRALGGRRAAERMLTSHSGTVPELLAVLESVPPPRRS